MNDANKKKNVDLSSLSDYAPDQNKDVLKKVGEDKPQKEKSQKKTTEDYVRVTSTLKKSTKFLLKKALLTHKYNEYTQEEFVDEAIREKAQKALSEESI